MPRIEETIGDDTDNNFSSRKENFLVVKKYKKRISLFGAMSSVSQEVLKYISDYLVGMLGIGK